MGSEPRRAEVCVQVGVLMPDGTVLCAAHECVGSMHFGEAAPHQTVLGVNGMPLGILQPDGTVVSAATGRRAGLLAPSGRVLDAAGRFVGTARTARLEGLVREVDGTVRNEDGAAVGRVAADGTIVITHPASHGGGSVSYGTAAMEVLPPLLCVYSVCAVHLPLCRVSARATPHAFSLRFRSARALQLTCKRIGRQHPVWTACGFCTCSCATECGGTAQPSRCGGTATAGVTAPLGQCRAAC